MDEKSLLHRLDGIAPGTTPSSQEEHDLVERLSRDSDARQLQQRINQFDNRIRQAMHEVSVPDGLADRILQRLTQSAGEAEASTTDNDSDSVSSAIADSDSPGSPQPIADTTSPAERSRRSAMWVRYWPAVAGALAATLLIGLTFWMSSVERITPEIALRLALQFHDQHDDAAGVLAIETPPPADLPFSDYLKDDAALRWRRVNDLLGRDGVAFHWGRATLYVLPIGLPGKPMRPDMKAEFPTRPGNEPTMTTGGRSLAAWQQDDLVYLLIVDGGEEAYRSVLRRPGGQLAMSRQPCLVSMAGPVSMERKPPAFRHSANLAAEAANFAESV